MALWINFSAKMVIKRGIIQEKINFSFFILIQNPKIKKDPWRKNIHPKSQNDPQNP